MVLAHDINERKRTKDVQISVDVTFDSMMLSSNTLDGLRNSGFFKPSPIQLHGIPLGKCGFDLFLEAKSGTGKTAVFTVIALEKLELDKGLQSVILAPTREIAAQISDVIKQLGSSYLGLNVEVVMGGLPLEEDIEKFRRKVHILVGSPGRMRHLIEDKHIDVSTVRMLVLDEADKLMDKSFVPDINYIFSMLPEQKQVIMSSATYPNKLKVIMQNYVQHAQHICPDSSSILLGIEQLVTTVKSNMNIVRQTQNKFEELLKILSKREFKQCLIFCNYQVRVRELCKMLIREKWPADQLHGQLDQTMRLDALKTLQAYKCRILVSTDLAARGIDASNVDLVIHFEPPTDWQTYLHRIGRAGRYGSHGIAISIVSEGKELTKFKEMIRCFSHSLKVNYLWSGDELDCNYCEFYENPEEEPTLTQEDISETPEVKDMYKILESRELIKTEFKEQSEQLETARCREISEVEEPVKHPKTAEIVNKSELNELSKILTPEEMKLLGLEEQQIEDQCNNLNEIAKYEIKENYTDNQSFDDHIFHSLESPDEGKLESFDALVASFKVHEHNCHENIKPNVEVRNVSEYQVQSNNIPHSSTHYNHEESKLHRNSEDDLTLNSDSVLNDNLQHVTLHEKIAFVKSQMCRDAQLHRNSGDDVTLNSVCGLDDNVKYVTSHEKIESVQSQMCRNAQLHQNSGDDLTLNSVSELDDNLKHVTSHEKIEFVQSQMNRDALQNAGLPVAFGSTKYSKRANKPRIRRNKEHALNNQNSNNTQNRSRDINIQPQINSNVFKEKYLKNSDESDTESCDDDGYDTRSGLYSSLTKYVPPQSKVKQSNVNRNSIGTMHSEINDNETEVSIDLKKKYNTWYKQLKIHMKQVEMSLYIDEMSKI